MSIAIKVLCDPSLWLWLTILFFVGAFALTPLSRRGAETALWMVRHPGLFYALSAMDLLAKINRWYREGFTGYSVNSLMVLTVIILGVRYLIPRFSLPIENLRLRHLLAKNL